ncbi:MAG: ATP-binding protein [Acidobacteriota bacterium]|nr:ATP-binding protein [Acidobacteriota bacterium]
MNLRRKLLTAFGALAVLVLLTAGIMFWVISQWKTTNAQIEDHYQRSLLLQRVRAATFRAFKEVPDAVAGDDPDSRQEFDVYIRPALDDFQRWSELAVSEEEQAQVRDVRQAFDVLVDDATLTFDLVEAGRQREAFELMEGKVEDNDFAEFNRLTEEAVASDQRFRQVVRESNLRTRRTAQVVLSAAAFSAVSLVLLLAAYLASDLFAPLREVEASLKAASQGDFTKRLDEERDDEFGALNREYNRLVEQIARREQQMAAGANENHDEAHDETNTTSRLTLHTLVAQLRGRILRFAGTQAADGDGDSADTAEDKRALVAKIEELAQSVARVTEFGFPLDLNLARTDVRTLLYEVLLRFHDDLSTRGISFELNVAPEVEYATIDRLKLREAIGELVRKALAALPERGGSIGLRARINGEADAQLLIEVADDGKGKDESLLDQTFDGGGAPRSMGKHIGLRFTEAIVEQHGGQLDFHSQQGEGTHVVIRLPVRT